MSTKVSLDLCCRAHSVQLIRLCRQTCPAQFEPYHDTTAACAPATSFNEYLLTEHMGQAGKALARLTTTHKHSDMLAGTATLGKDNER